MNNFIWGNETFQNYETIAGGSGAGPGFDGAPCVQVHMTNTRATDPRFWKPASPSGWSAWRIAGIRRRRCMDRRRRACTASCASSNPSPSQRSAPTAKFRSPGARAATPAPSEKTASCARAAPPNTWTETPGPNSGGRRHRHAHPWRRRLGQTHLIPFIFPKIRSGEREGWKTPRRRNAGQTVRHFGFRPHPSPAPLARLEPTRVAMRGFGPGAQQRPVKRERGENPRLPPQL
jgi:hypothetical protein